MVTYLNSIRGVKNQTTNFGHKKDLAEDAIPIESSVA